MSQHVEWISPTPGLYGSSFRLGEWLSGPVTPLFEEWALTRQEAAMHAAHWRWSGQPAPRPHHVVINGWYFYSLAWLPVTPRAMLRWAPLLLWHGLRPAVAGAAAIAQSDSHTPRGPWHDIGRERCLLPAAG